MAKQPERSRDRPPKRAAAGGTTIEVVQEKEQQQASVSGDKNTQVKRPRGRPPQHAAANLDSGAERSKRKTLSKKSEDVGIQESPASVAKSKIWNNLDSFEDFERYWKNLDNSDGYSGLRLFYEMALYMKKLPLNVISLVKGPLIIDPEVCQKEKIEKMEVILDKKTKKSFYYTIIDSKKQLWTRKQMDRVVQPNKYSVGIGKDCKHFCKTLKGCKLENGKCIIAGKSDHVLNHIRGQLGFAFDCLYCDPYKTANTQHFKKHFINYHWSRGFDEVQLSRQKSTKSADSVDGVSDDGSESEDNVDGDSGAERKKTSSKESENVGSNSDDGSESEDNVDGDSGANRYAHQTFSF